LSASNYGTWEDNVGAYLGTKGLLGQIDGTDEQPLPENPDKWTSEERKELREWETRKAKASGEIWLAVEETQKVHIKLLQGNPTAMWIALKNVHVQKK
ncbi:hypothetical protein C8R43DRAFT_816680, partial [Mycena crocata]